MINLKKEYFALALLILITVPPALNMINVKGETVAAQALESSYKQDQLMHVVATMVNNESFAFNIIAFHVAFYPSKSPRTEVKPLLTINKTLSYNLEPGKGLTVELWISLSSFAPGEYNVSAYFRILIFTEEDTVNVFEHVKIRILPSIEIPPSVFVIIAIMSGIIIIFVGYGLAKRFSRKKS